MMNTNEKNKAKKSEKGHIKWQVKLETGLTEKTGLWVKTWREQESYLVTFQEEHLHEEEIQAHNVSEVRAGLVPSATEVKATVAKWGRIEPEKIRQIHGTHIPASWGITVENMPFTLRQADTGKGQAETHVLTGSQWLWCCEHSLEPRQKSEDQSGAYFNSWRENMVPRSAWYLLGSFWLVIEFPVFLFKEEQVGFYDGADEALAGKRRKEGGQKVLNISKGKNWLLLNEMWMAESGRSSGREQGKGVPRRARGDTI